METAVQPSGDDDDHRHHHRSVRSCMMTVETPPSIIALHLPSSVRPTLVSATARYIAAATSKSITCFQLDPPQALAHWKPPCEYLITAIKVSPDSNALAAVIQGPYDSALVLLHPHSLSRLFRLALPPLTRNPAMCFVSPPQFSTRSTLSLLPDHLQHFFASIDDSSPVSKPPSKPTAQFALVLSPTTPSNSPVILVFHKGYARLHHLTTLPQPHPLTLLSPPNLTSLCPELVFFDTQTVHHLSPSGPHRIHSTFPIRTVLATVRYAHPTVAAIVDHPADNTCIAVFRENSTTLTPITNPLPNVALMPTSNPKHFLLGAVTATGVTVVAELVQRPYIVIEVIPRANDHVSNPAQQVAMCVAPTPLIPFTVVVNGSIVMCRYSASGKDEVT